MFSKNTTPSTITSIQTIIHFQSTPLTSRHIGLPILFGKYKTAAFFDILEKIQVKIEGGRANTLSQVGRIVLIKNVALAIPSYVISSFMMPANLNNQMDKSFKKMLARISQR
jgi:hypothetical protein